VKLLLSVALYVGGGGAPVKAIEKYSDGLLFLHIKDVKPVSPGASSKNPYRFVELGRGRVDLPAVFAALERVKFRGWLIVELDGNPDAAREPKASALINKEYREKRIGLTV